MKKLGTINRKKHQKKKEKMKCVSGKNCLCKGITMKEHGGLYIWSRQECNFLPFGLALNPFVNYRSLSAKVLFCQIQNAPHSDRNAYVLFFAIPKIHFNRKSRVGLLFRKSNGKKKQDTSNR